MNLQLIKYLKYSFGRQAGRKTPNRTGYILIMKYYLLLPDKRGSSFLAAGRLNAGISVSAVSGIATEIFVLFPKINYAPYNPLRLGIPPLDFCKALFCIQVVQICSFCCYNLSIQSCDCVKISHSGLQQFCGDFEFLVNCVNIKH